MAQSRTQSRGSSAHGGHEAAQEAIIGAGARVRGRVSGDGDLTIAGEVEGDIVLRGNLTVDAGGRATSNIDAGDVTIAGALEGDVSASGQVTLVRGSRTRGNLSVTGGGSGVGIAIEDGAQFAGRLECEFELPEGLGGASSSGASSSSSSSGNASAKRRN
jgi:cytoskeletal protein CcmA (bactofilin family)